MGVILALILLLMFSISRCGALCMTGEALMSVVANESLTIVSISALRRSSSTLLMMLVMRSVRTRSSLLLARAAIVL